MGHHKATSNLMDCNFIHYSIQLSLYRYILEKNYGLNVTDAAISHITDEKVISYKTEYLQKEIEEMFSADRAFLKQKAEDGLTKVFF
jgi:CRISPR/Cas system-associated exonuclease Cas4 (RecB family)